MLSQRSSSWLESCDLRVGQAEADFLRNQPGGGSISFTVTLTDRDVRGGDESISSLEVVITPKSLAERESSVLWHRLFSQVGDRKIVFRFVNVFWFIVSTEQNVGLYKLPVHFLDYVNLKI